MSGTVADSSGAVIPNAKVQLISETTGAVRSTVSNGSGFFNFAAIQPGSYAVIITSEGFTTWERKNMEFTQGASVSIPSIVLAVSGTKQDVLVVAASDSSVPTDTGQTSQTLNERIINELSIQGRDAAELIKIMPGMGMNNGLGQGMWNSLVTANNTGPIGNFSANGTQPNGAMTMTSDGANLLDPGNQGTQTANINQNQTAEVTILSSAYGAEFAKGPITFQAIGKSGGNQFHGGAYLYARHSVLNAEDSYLKAQNIPAPQDHYYYPGGDFGGPVIIPGLKFNRNHDKLFFYAAYEYMNQQPAGSLISRFIPTEQMMQGNFSPAYLASLGPGFQNNYGKNATVPCATASTGPGCSSLSLPGGIIPKSMLDPNSYALWKTYPKANVDPTTNSIGANYEYLVNPPTNRWELRLRGDYNLSERTKIFFSYNRQAETDQNPISVWWSQGSNSLPYPSAMPASQLSQVYSTNVTHVFSPTLTNEFVFADAQFINPVKLANPAAVDPAKVGFNMVGLFKDPYTQQLPNAGSWDNSTVGYFAPQFGEKFQGGAFGKLSQAPNISDNVTKVWGTHTFKTGFYWDFQRNEQANGGYNNGPQGWLDFENYGANSSGNPAADFVMGRVTGLTQSNGAAVSDFKYHQYSFYLNDQWKATRRLTLTLGLRFDHEGSWAPTSGPGLAVWDPATYNNTSSAGAWTGLQWHAINSKIPVSGYPSRPFFYEPRIGVAYDLFGDGKTVIRGGFGIYRYQFAYNSVSGGTYNAPLGFQTDSTTWNCCVGYTSFNQYSPSLGPAGLGSGIGALQMGDTRTPWTGTYNATLSQRVPWNSVVEVQYSGNNSHDMLINGAISDINKIPLYTFFTQADPTTGTIVPTTSSSFNANHYYANKNYTSIQVTSHGSYSNYNAFITSWQKQSGRVTITANYTFSKVLGIRDNETDNGTGNGSTVDPFSIGKNYGVLNFDHTHIVNAAYIVNLPSPIHGNKLFGGAVNGWEVSGITQFQSGAPIQSNTGGNLNAQWPSSYSEQNFLGTNAAQALVMPVLTCDPRKNLSSGQYFNPNCFAPPAPGSNGSTIWPYIKGPSFFNSDLALYKNFTFRERQKIQFRFSAFNFLNHPLPQLGISGNADLQLNFNGPNGTIASTNQNALTSGKALFTTGRRVIELTVKYNF